jgi:hypothetical protein
MTQVTTQVIEDYYEVLAGGPGFSAPRLRETLADDLSFHGPAGPPRTGADAFVDGVRGFVETVRQLTFLQRVQDASGVASLYDATLPAGTVRFAEFLELTDGRISSIRLLFNPAEYRERGGR